MPSFQLTSPKFTARAFRALSIVSLFLLAAQSAVPAFDVPVFARQFNTSEFGTVFAFGTS